jgi:hypothetical protein
MGTFLMTVSQVIERGLVPSQKTAEGLASRCEYSLFEAPDTV